MERWSQPVAVITTIQPFLLFWAMSIAFFLTMTIVAIISKNKTWREVGLLFLVSYLVVISCTMLASEFVLGVEIFRMEIVTYDPQL